jgi:hypothetical protein
MGNYFSSNKALDGFTSQFLNYYILDKEYNIIIGIYKDSNTMINQGICVGHYNNEISKIRFGIFHRYADFLVELFFENNIKLVLSKNKDNNIKIVLTKNNYKIEKYIDINLIKNIIPMNSNSEYIDLIFKII